MLYIVEVRVIGGRFVTSMTQMRTWLDHRRIEPDAFRHSSGGAGVTFRVDFKIEAEAMEFARAFGGRLVGVPLPHPSTALWSSHADEAGLQAQADGAALASPAKRTA